MKANHLKYFTYYMTSELSLSQHTILGTHSNDCLLQAKCNLTIFLAMIKGNWKITHGYPSKQNKSILYFFHFGTKYNAEITRVFV